MKMKKLFSVFVIAIIAILMVTVALGSVQAVDAAPKKVKVTGNANGGKIGTAKTTTTTVKTNAKIGKLLKAPKRTGYEFKGWYTKKVNGKKITTTTKVKKKVIYHAQWKKKTNTSTDSGLIGMWSYKFLGLSGTDTYIYNFKKDGSFQYFINSNLIEGKYYTSNNKIYLSELYHTYDGSKWGGNKVVEYVIGSDNSGKYLKATQINRDGTYFEIKANSMKFYKEN